MAGPYDPLPASFPPNHRISLVASGDTLLYFHFFGPLTGVTVFPHVTHPQAGSAYGYGAGVLSYGRANDSSSIDRTPPNRYLQHSSYLPCTRLGRQAYLFLVLCEHRNSGPRAQELWLPPAYGLATVFSAAPHLVQWPLRHDDSGSQGRFFWLHLPGITGTVNVGRKGTCGRSAAGTMKIVDRPRQWKIRGKCI